MSKRLSNPWQEVISVSHGVVMVKFNRNLVTFFLIFSVFQYPILIEILIP